MKYSSSSVEGGSLFGAHKKKQSVQSVLKDWVGFSKEDERVRILGWAITAFFASAIVTQLLLDHMPNPLLGIGFLVGAALAARNSSLLGTTASRSTRWLLHLERVQRPTVAGLVHGALKRVAPQHVRVWENRRRLQIGSAALATFAITLLYGIIVLTLVPSSGWQSVLLLAPILGVAVLLPLTIPTDIMHLVFVGAYAVIFFSNDPFVALLGAMLLTAAALRRSWKLEDGKLQFIAVVGTFSILTWWGTLSGDSRAIVILQGTVAQLAIISWLAFVLPYALRPRQALERTWARWIIGVSVTWFTLLMVWLVGRLAVSLQASILLSVLLVAAAAAMVAWKTYQRYSYAKYFFLSAVGAVLLAATPLLPEGPVPFILWFTAAVCLSLIGKLFDSYATRLMGLAALLGASAYFMLRMVPGNYGTIVSGGILSDTVWGGLLLSGFTALVATWFADTMHETVATRQVNAKVISLVLYALSAAIIVTVLVDQLIIALT